jgi:hypothetical protein
MPWFMRCRKEQTTRFDFGHNLPMRRKRSYPLAQVLVYRYSINSNTRHFVVYSSLQIPLLYISPEREH